MEISMLGLFKQMKMVTFYGPNTMEEMTSITVMQLLNAVMEVLQ